MTRTNQLILSIIPFIVSYAIVSSIGQPQHTYPGASRTAVVNQNIP